MAVKVKLAGIKELKSQVQNLIKAVEPARAEPVLLEAAEMIATGIEKKAPQGPTGNLKKSVKAKQLKRRGKNPAPAIAAIDRKIAPHAHLVEKGSKGVRVAKRGKYKGKSFGVMPKSNFFRKGLRSTQKKALHHVVTKLQAMIEGAAK